MAEPATNPAVVDPFVRACLVQVMHGVTRDRTALARFTGALWLTYRQGRRLRPRQLSGPVPPGVIPGATWPQMLGNMATILTNRHGQVLCRSLIEPGFTGLITVGYAMNCEQESRHVIAPRPTLIGVIAQIDTGQELVLIMDTAVGVPEQPVDDTGLATLVTNTWAVADTIHNMSNAPMPADAADLAQQVLDGEPALRLESGTRITLSGSHLQGTQSHQAAHEFVNRAAAAAAADRAHADPAPDRPLRATRISVVTRRDLSETVAAFTAATVEPAPLVARTYRAID